VFSLFDNLGRFMDDVVHKMSAKLPGKTSTRAKERNPSPTISFRLAACNYINPEFPDFIQAWSMQLRPPLRACSPAVTVRTTDTVPALQHLPAALAAVHGAQRSATGVVHGTPHMMEVAVT